MGGELKEKVAQGVAWSMAEKIGSMLLAMAVRLVILRLLTRDILGFMSIPSAVVTVLLVIVDSGFSQSLVRHKGPSQSDYKSVFLFNIAVSAVLYGVLVALAPLAARWYSMPEIARIAPVFFLLLPLESDLPFVAGGRAYGHCAGDGRVGHLEPRGGACDRGRDADRAAVVAERLAPLRQVRAEAPARDGAVRVQSDGDGPDFEFL